MCDGVCVGVNALCQSYASSLAEDAEVTLGKLCMKKKFEVLQFEVFLFSSICQMVMFLDD